MGPFILAEATDDLASLSDYYRRQVGRISDARRRLWLEISGRAQWSLTPISSIAYFCDSFYF